MQGSQWTITLETDPDVSLRAKILQPLAAYNESVAGPGHWGPLAITGRGDGGEGAGGRGVGLDTASCSSSS